MSSLIQYFASIAGSAREKKQKWILQGHPLNGYLSEICF